jgi:transcriptional regulator with XRE-family HTH domain
VGIGKNIQKYRVKKRYTQKELAEAIGMSKFAISKYEADSLNPSLKALKKIAGALEISLQDLFGTQPYDLKNREIDFMESLDKLTDNDKKLIMSIINRLTT